MAINFTQSTMHEIATLSSRRQQFAWWIFNHFLPLFWHICGFSSLLSAQSGSPSHINVLCMQSPLLHVNCRSIHFRFRAESRVKDKKLKLILINYCDFLCNHQTTTRPARQVTIYSTSSMAEYKSIDSFLKLKLISDCFSRRCDFLSSVLYTLYTFTTKIFFQDQNLWHTKK